MNGAFGVDLQRDPDGLGHIAERLPSVGVTTWCPTLITGPTDRLAAALAAWRGAMHAPSERPRADPVGWHLEGPFLSEKRLGAHPATWRREIDPDLVGEWRRADGVALVTLAPELNGALGAIETLRADDVVVSIGHTDADTVATTEAVDAGASMVTHLGNAMRGFHHRDPGPIGVALTDDRLTVGLIADGVHTHLDTIRLALRAASGRVAIVSDAVASAGVPGTAVTGAHLDDGTLAGATAMLDRVLADRSDDGSGTFGDLVAAMTETPARLLGLADRGRLEAGRRADVVVWDPEARPGTRVVATWVAGRLAHLDDGHPDAARIAALSPAG